MRLSVRGVLRQGCWQLLLLTGVLATVCAARDYRDGFDGERPTWEATYDRNAARIVGHSRSRATRHQGETAELFEIEGLAPVTVVQLEHALPPARLIDDLVLTLWLQSNQDGATLSVRVVLPRQIDPRTGKPLTVVLDGESYAKPGPWKKVACDNLPTRLRRLLPQLRKILQSETGAARHDVDVSGAYADAAIVVVRMDRGVRSRFAIDDLQWGPIVDATAERELLQVAATETAPPKPNAELRGTFLYVNGQPYFPRIVPYHGERPGDLSRMRVNLAWVPDYQDEALLQELEKSGLRSMAVPPRPTAADGSPLDPSSAQMAPFGPGTAPILFWYLGTEIPGKAKREVSLWVDQIQNADQLLLRPVTGDVVGAEKAYSRLFSMTSVSRPALHTSFGFKNNRDWLIERRNLAYPGTFFWTWIQIEPSPALNQQRLAAGQSPIVVEPEQIRFEVYGALAAGCRGIGYWTHSSLEGSDPGSIERKLMMAQLNMELELLEPWLATGSPASQTQFNAKLSPARKFNHASVAKGNDAHSDAQNKALINDHKTQREAREQISRDLEAAIIKTDYGTLVLPIWYADDAQFVPGQMTANDATLVVPGVGDAFRAWEISTTKIDSLESKRVAGGKQIVLKKFDMTAIILFTDDEMLVERLRLKMNTLAETSARVNLELARAKFNRVIEVDRRLREQGQGQPDAGTLLTKAKQQIALAETQWQGQRYHDSRKASADCMQYLRILQHAYWGDAVGRIKNHAAASSPHTLCFQTLPDHWEMVARHGRARHAGGRNLLRSGDFEDYQTMVAEGWKHEQTDIPGVRAVAELYPKAHKGTYSLRLIATAATGQDPPNVITDRPVVVTTPPVTVYKGQLVHVSGWVKVAAPSLRNLEGAVLYDSLGGPATGLRWRSKSDWQPFELIREANETGDFTLTMALTGLGEICFDDLQILALETQSSPQSTGEKAGGSTSRGGAFDFLKKIPRFGGKTETE